MFRRPSSKRRRWNRSPIGLNLVPMLDALVTLIAFLLFSMSFLALVSIESPAPMAATRDLQKKLEKRPLQLTVSLHKNDTEIWSPFGRIETSKVPNMPDGLPDTFSVHGILVGVKQKFPTETQVVLVPFPGATYDILIAVMDCVRSLEPTDPPFFVKNEETGIDEPVQTLFPEVVFGNLLGDS